MPPPNADDNSNGHKQQQPTGTEAAQAIDTAAVTMISSNHYEAEAASSPIGDVFEETEFAVEGEDQITQSADLVPDDNHYNNNNNSMRKGTISSARFNILSTMVGGGCLSLPLAFSRSGNALVGPFLLIGAAMLTEFCFVLLIRAARVLTPDLYTADALRHRSLPVGKDTFESLAAAAFGPRAYLGCTMLVTAMCFFGTVGYAVLLRDMLEPVNDMVFHIDRSGSKKMPLTWTDNVSMLVVVLLVTPACTLKTLTALEKFGAASMFAILILGSCIVFRSAQCMIEHPSSMSNLFQFTPDSWKDVLDVIPLYISCYVCHYNLPPVHNDLQQPTDRRVKYWLKSTVWGSTLFYCILGMAGSLYGHCVGETVEGNILLNFKETDPLLFLGRLCFAVTITLAFPMLTIPARDIVIRALPQKQTTGPDGSMIQPNESLTQALLEHEFSPTIEADIENAENAINATNDTVEGPVLPDDDSPAEDEDGEDAAAVMESAPTTAPPTRVITETLPDNSYTPTTPANASWLLRLTAAIGCFWTAVAVACCVSSIDIVWDLLGSSLSILLSYLIPAGCYIAIVSRKNPQASSKISTAISWLLWLVFVPLMFISTANAAYNTFFSQGNDDSNDAPEEPNHEF